MKSIFQFILNRAYVVAESSDQAKILGRDILEKFPNDVNITRVSSEKVTVFDWKKDAWEVGTSYLDGVKSVRSLNNTVIMPDTGYRATIPEVVLAIKTQFPKQEINEDLTCYRPDYFYDRGCVGCGFHKFCVAQANQRTRLKSENPADARQYDENVFVGCDIRPYVVADRAAIGDAPLEVALK